MGKVIHAVFARKPHVAQPHPAKIIPLQSAKARAFLLYERGAKIDEDPERYAEALYLYHQAVELDPTLAIAFTNLANIYFHMGKWRKAAQGWRRAMLLDPRQPEAPYNMGYYHMGRGRYKTAVRFLLQALENLPKFADAQFNLGIAYQELGNHKMAIQHLKKYLSISESDPYLGEAKRLIEVSQRLLLLPQQ